MLLFHHATTLELLIPDLIIDLEEFVPKLCRTFFLLYDLGSVSIAMEIDLVF